MQQTCFYFGKWLSGRQPTDEGLCIFVLTGSESSLFTADLFIARVQARSRGVFDIDVVATTRWFNGLC